MSASTQLQAFFTVFAAVFFAELGDKTQLATMLFASNSEASVSKWTIFLAASAALTLSAAIGVVAGSVIGKYIAPRTLNIIAGLGFVLIGLWTLWQAFRA